MKKLIFPIAAIMVAGLIWAFSSGETAVTNTQLNIGDKAPLTDIKMKGTAGESLSLKDAAKENGLLVIFSCNTCPFVIAWEETYPELADLAKENRIGMVLLNPNEAYRTEDDSMEKMKKHAEEAGYRSPYLIDENHKLADAFGARTTPHIFLLDKDMKLVYRGLIDDRFSNRERTISNHYLNNAIKNLAEGKAIEPATTPEKGCSIKRVKA